MKEKGSKIIRLTYQQNNNINKKHNNILKENYKNNNKLEKTKIY